MLQDLLYYLFSYYQFSGLHPLQSRSLIYCLYQIVPQDLSAILKDLLNHLFGFGPSIPLSLWPNHLLPYRPLFKSKV